MKSTLFAATPARNHRLTFTIIASLMFHGALVGGAAFFIRPPEPPPKLRVTEFFPANLPPVDELSAPPEASPSTPEPETVATPLATMPDIIVDPLPAPPDPDIYEPTPATPPPVAVHQPVTQARLRTTPVQSARTGVSAPVTAQTGAAGGMATGNRWRVSSKPSYPQALRLAHIQGTGMVKVTTDAAGRVVSAVIVQSSGNSSLDEHTCQYARSAWNGPANATTNVPFTYRLQ